MEALGQLCITSALSVVFGQAAQSDWSPGPEDAIELWTSRGGDGRYRNIISLEYASMPLLWWSWDLGIEECWITHQCYLDKLAALWHSGIVGREMWPQPNPFSRNPNFICRDSLFITIESTCISSLWCDASILLPALEKKRTIPCQ